MMIIWFGLFCGGSREIPDTKGYHSLNENISKTHRLIPHVDCQIAPSPRPLPLP